jgi:hypothetical protein
MLLLPPTAEPAFAIAARVVRSAFGPVCLRPVVAFLEFIFAVLVAWPVFTQAQEATVPKNVLDLPSFTDRNLFRERDPLQGSSRSHDSGSVNLEIDFKPKVGTPIRARVPLAIHSKACSSTANEEGRTWHV